MEEQPNEQTKSSVVSIPEAQQTSLPKQDQPPDRQRKASMFKSPTLFKRFPYLLWRPRVDEQIVPREEQAKYPTLAEDFQYLEQELLPHFQELDNEALRAQNHFRLEQVVLIFGGTLATMLGAVLAAFPGLRIVGLIETLLAAGLAAVAWRARALKAQESYFTARLKAETLRSDYFLFLGWVGPYADENNRVQHLIRRLATIKSGGGET